MDPDWAPAPHKVGPTARGGERFTETSRPTAATAKIGIFQPKRQESAGLTLFVMALSLSIVPILTDINSY